MDENKVKNITFDGFSKLDLNQRLDKLFQMGFLTKEDIKTLKTRTTLKPELAENFIENVIGYFQIPLGIGAHLKIDNAHYAIPMAVEETSIIASLSKTAKWIRKTGTITTKTLGNGYMIGQIQIAKASNFNKFKSLIENNKQNLITDANSNIAKGLVKRGGGVKDIIIRKILRAHQSSMAVLHIMVDTIDAMGANIITQICEFLKEPIEKLTHEKVTMCILSNLNDNKLVQAKVIIHDIEPTLGNKIAEASLFAALDPYRASTNNKGVLNGIDPILIATGNDWRAVEAGIHSYACKDGKYGSITKWQYNDSSLIGKLIAPITVGIVGGMTKLHPMAKMCLNIMKIKSANHLARIIAAVGLVQNLGAITALTTSGLVKGHMNLHISNLSLNAGAKEDEIPLLQKQLEELLKLKKHITLSSIL